MVALISRRLEIPANSARLVRVVLEMAVEAEASGEAFTGERRPGAGRKAKIIFGTPQAAIALHGAKTGRSITECAIMINEFAEARYQDAEPHLVSWHAVQDFFSRCPAVHTHKRQTKQSGTDDPGGGLPAPVIVNTSAVAHSRLSRPSTQIRRGPKQASPRACS